MIDYDRKEKMASRAIRYGLLALSGKRKTRPAPLTQNNSTPTSTISSQLLSYTRINTQGSYFTTIQFQYVGELPLLTSDLYTGQHRLKKHEYISQLPRERDDSSVLQINEGSCLLPEFLTRRDTIKLLLNVNKVKLQYQFLMEYDF